MRFTRTSTTAERKVAFLPHYWGPGPLMPDVIESI